MKNLFFSSVIASVLIFGIVGSARATILNYDFESVPFQALYSEGHYDSLAWALFGTTVIVTAHEVINDDSGNLNGSGIGSFVVDGVWVDHNTDGLGAKSYPTDNGMKVDGSS